LKTPAIKKVNKGWQLVLTLRKPSKLKKLLSILIVFSFACSKQWGKTCWDCEVTRMTEQLTMKRFVMMAHIQNLKIDKEIN
jgi:hypothetical protein